MRTKSILRSSIIWARLAEAVLQCRRLICRHFRGEKLLRKTGVATIHYLWKYSSCIGLSPLQEQGKIVTQLDALGHSWRIYLPWLCTNWWPCSRAHFPQVSFLALQKLWMWPYFLHRMQCRISLLGSASTTACALPSRKTRPLSSRRSQKGLELKASLTRKELLLGRWCRSQAASRGPLIVGFSAIIRSMMSLSCFFLIGFLSGPFSISTPCRSWKRTMAGNCFIGTATEWKRFWAGFFWNMSRALSRDATSLNESTTDH